jgi:hypothetical protein
MSIISQALKNRNNKYIFNSFLSTIIKSIYRKSIQHSLTYERTEYFSCKVIAMRKKIFENNLEKRKIRLE